MTLAGLPAEDMSATHGVDKGDRMHLSPTVEADPWGSEQERSRFLWYLLAIPMTLISIPVWIKNKLMWKNKKFPGIYERNCSVPWTTRFFDRWSRTLQEIRQGAASFRALDMIYHRKVVDLDPRGRWFAQFWLGMRNAQAVRNRGRLTRIELLKAVRKIAPTIEGPVNIFSIASGSAEAVLDVVKVVQTEGIDVRIFLLDKDPLALEYSMKLAEDMALSHLVTTIEDDIRSIEVVADSLPPIHLLEMVGFLDYRPYKKGVQLFRRIKSVMAPGAAFITAQIAWNTEVPFMWTALQWPMIYRSRSKFHKMFLEAGFLTEHTCVFPEAQSIHNIGVAWNKA